jgi:hypothetical protein
VKSKKRAIDFAGNRSLGRIPVGSWSANAAPLYCHKCETAAGHGDERHAMNFGQTFMLRTKLRQVNMEYSALVRDRMSERRFVRMDELRIERWALMNLLFGGANRKRRPLASQSDVALQQLADRHREGSEHLAFPIPALKHFGRVSS